jgi:hypothetical protein
MAQIQIILSKQKYNKHSTYSIMDTSLEYVVRMDEWFDTKVPLLAKVFAYLEVCHIQKFQNAIKTQEYTEAYARPYTWKQYVIRYANAQTCFSCNTLRGTMIFCSSCDHSVCTDCIVCCSLCNNDLCHPCSLQKGCTQCFE